MRNIIEALFDLFFPKELDDNGNEVDPPEGDDSYAMKVAVVIILFLSFIFLSFVF